MSDVVKRTKDQNGLYVREQVVPPALKPLSLIDDDVSIDNILSMQRTGLNRLTKHLVTAISQGDITKDTPQQLATCIKIALELKDKQEELTDEQLQKLAAEE